MNSYRFRDADAIVPDPTKGRGAVSGLANSNYLTKRKRRDKSLEIVFDPKAHKEYVTGFRKRKQQRRKEALKTLEKKHHQQRLEERAERRQAMKAQLDALDDQGKTWEDEESLDNVGVAAASKRRKLVEPEVQVYRSSAVISTVTVEPIFTHSDEEKNNDSPDHEEAASDSSNDHSHDEERGVGAVQNPCNKILSRDLSIHTKLSKSSLRIMEKTKLKIEGKRSRSGTTSSKNRRSGAGSGTTKRKGKGRSGKRKR